MSGLQFLTSKKGFTLAETLLALFCGSLVMLVITMMLSLMLKMNTQTYVLQHEIAYQQLQLELALSTDIHIDDNQLCYSKYDKLYCLSQDKHRLVKREGYEIYMINVDHIQFSMTLDEIIMEGVVDEKPFKFIFSNIQ